ncbi:MAG TPA: cytochrome c oxidase subunit 3 [Gemmatimonadaceae bacterium]|nr:cytochrome c oxidase subunit 3 [Gemmatimonadaceae bacterium]
MKPLRPTADAAALPSVTFGQRSMMWWGTLGFMTIEGWTIALLVAAYLYLRQNYAAWPPLRTPNPSLLIPTINVALMLVSIVPAWIAARAAGRLDTTAVKRWLVITCIIELPIIILRWWELWALNTRWDTTAYGSAAWTIVGFHTSLLVLDVLDTYGLTLFYFLRRQPVKSFSDTADNSFYWYFTVGIWIPIYLIVYVGPRIA